MTEATDSSIFFLRTGKWRVVIRPTSDVNVAPADGTVTVTMDGSKPCDRSGTDRRLEVLIHIGVDTVKPEGGRVRSTCKDRR